MRRLTAVTTLVLGLLTVGLAVSPFAGAAEPKSAEMSATSLAIVSKLDGGFPEISDQVHHSIQALAMVSAPNFSRMRRLCKKAYRKKWRKRACIRRVSRQQKRWQRLHATPRMTIAKAMGMAKHWADNRYRKVGYDKYSPSGYDWGDCAIRPDNTARCSWIVWTGYVNPVDPSGNWTMQCLGRAVVWFKGRTLWVNNEDGTVSCGLVNQLIPPYARPIRDYPEWLITSG